MADIPAYLQGSQTGGILQNLAQPQQSYIPSAPGATPQGYTPGYGQVPLAPAGNPAIAAAISGATSGGNIDWPRVQRQLGLTSAQMDSMIKGESFNSSNYHGTGDGLSSYTSPPSASSPSIGNTSNGTVIGQSDAWLSPAELAAKNTGFQAGSQSSQTGGGGGGSGSNPSAPSGGGLNLSGVGGNVPTGSTPNSLQQSSTPIGSTIGYQNPGSVNNTGMVGYGGVGNGSSGGQAGVLQMNHANPQDSLSQYKNTPGYQLLNAPGAYQASPGYQYAMDQALGQVQNGASAHGMLESGAVLKSMQQTASGLAQQDYGNWWNRQNQLYGDYQNRLQGLAGGPTGSQDAMTTGANSAQANLQTGSNLGSLFGNQGTSGMGGIINTAAAQSGNMINAGQQQATVNAANQATQLAGATLASNKGLF